jgi:hypothetical protein
MTGGGAGSLAFGKEQSFLGSLTTDGSSNDEFWQFGRDEAVTELSLDNQLQRLDEAGAVESVESVKTGFEGAVSIEATISSDVHNDVEELVFNGAGQFATGRPQSSQIFVGIDYLSGTTERVLKGCIPIEYTINYTEGGLLTYALSLLYADEEKNTSHTPTGVTTVSDGTSAAWHSLDVQLDGTTQTSKLQELSLSISNIARFHRGGEGPTPVDAVIAAPETTLDMTAIYDTEQRLELAYGGDGSTTPQDRLTDVSAALDITVDGTNVSTYNLTKLKPATGDWSDVINAGDTDATDPTTFNVDGEPAVSVA